MNFEKITEKTITKIEQAAMLQLIGVERDQIRADLQQMITYVNKLQELDTTGMAAVPHPFAGVNVFREDRVSAEEGLAEALRHNAPEGMDDWYLVPRTIAENKERQPGGECDV